MCYNGSYVGYAQEYIRFSIVILRALAFSSYVGYAQEYIRFSIVILRALALENVNAISKDFLAFHSSKTFASENCKPHYCKNFCNNATVQF